MSAAAAATAPLEQQRYPSAETMYNAGKLALNFFLKGQDKPILMDYWMPSLEKRSKIGVKSSTGEKLLILNKDEYTSPISKMVAGNPSKTELIMVSENSIYIVAAGMDVCTVGNI